MEMTRDCRENGRESGINTPLLILLVWQQLEELWLTNDFELIELLCFILGSYNFWLCFQTYWEAWRKFCASLHLLPKSWPDKGETWSATLRGTHWPRDHNDAISRWIRRFGGETLTETNIKPVTAAPTEWRHLLVSCQMTSEKREQKFHTDDASWLCSVGNLLRPIRRCVISIEFQRSFLRRHLAGKPALASWNVGCSGDERLLNFENFLLTLAFRVYELDDDTKETSASSWRRDV